LLGEITKRVPLNFENSELPGEGGLGAPAGEGLRGSGQGRFRSACGRSVEDVNKRGDGVVGQGGEEKPPSMP